jgi:curli biogenesis system outer membrane secretion channel CsgG
MRHFRSIGVIFAGLALTLLVVVGTALSQSKPKLAVIEFKNKANNQWWYHGGAAAAQDAFITELVKLGKFTVIDREQLEEIMHQKNLTLSGDLDPKMAVKVGKALGVRYLLTGSVTEYGAAAAAGNKGGFSAGKRSFVAALNSRLIDTSTGEVVWADQARGESSTVKVSVGGFGGGVDDQRMFDKVMKPTIVTLVAKLKAADLVK